jgi:hypothetical protein
MEREIERALVDHITENVNLHQQGKLDSSRVLPLELYEEMIIMSAPAEQRSVLFAQNG